ncbi:MAG: Clp protease ClpS [Phycisphaerales bacterium]|nr:Clp protease ClpS [Phycisphaerales bacterium]
MPTDTLEKTTQPPDKTANTTKNKPKQAPTKPTALPPYHVVLLDDNDHSHEYVMEMLKAIFGYHESMGFTLADKVDSQGRAVVFTTHREHAELKRDQIQAYGNDWRVATCKGSMSAIIVKVED